MWYPRIRLAERESHVLACSCQNIGEVKPMRREATSADRREELGPRSWCFVCFAGRCTAVKMTGRSSSEHEPVLVRVITGIMIFR
jgi:hypothetical protein